MQTRIVIDGRVDLTLARHSQLDTVVYFVEELVADANRAFHNIDYFEYLVVLMLNHVPVVFVQSGLETLHKLHEESTHLDVLIVA